MNLEERLKQVTGNPPAVEVKVWSALGEVLSNDAKVKALFNLDHIATLDLDTFRSYSFDERGVWKDEKGVLWTVRTSGCSCPSPYEEVVELERFFLKDAREEFDKARKEGCAVPTLEEWEVFEKLVQPHLSQEDKL